MLTPMYHWPTSITGMHFFIYLSWKDINQRIPSREDAVPIVPGRPEFLTFIPVRLTCVLGRFLGYHHPSGEVHIQDSGAWLACPGTYHNHLTHHQKWIPIDCETGQDNTSDQCIVGDVSNIFEGESGDHAGPYDGVRMGCWVCQDFIYTSYIIPQVVVTCCTHYDKMPSITGLGAEVDTPDNCVDDPCVMIDDPWPRTGLRISGAIASCKRTVRGKSSQS